VKEEEEKGLGWRGIEGMKGLSCARRAQLLL
jgi:hypothetical protein